MNVLLDAVSPVLRAVASPHVGIVPVVEECLASVDEPPLVRISCDPAAGDELIGASLGHVGGLGGTGLSREAAVGAAIGEAVERYSATYLPHERIVLACADELGAGVVPPDSFALFHDSQYARTGFPFVPFTRNTRARWVEGRELTSGAPAWLPAELVFLGDVVRPGEQRIGYATSSGMACAESAELATERGLLELLERDAFMLVWSNRISPPRLDWSHVATMLALEQRYFAPTGLDYVALDLSAFHHLPIVLAVVRAEGAGPGALGVGAAAAAEPERAWWKALSEAFASRGAGRRLALHNPERTYAQDGSDVLTFEDHIHYYSDPGRAAGAVFLTASSERARVDELPALGGRTSADRLEELAARAHRAGSQVYVVDVTSPDVRSVGLCVVKVVTPGLCPLDVAHPARFLGAPRLLDMSERDGLTARCRSVEDLNPLPHPFP